MLSNETHLLNLGIDFEFVAMLRIPTDAAALDILGGFVPHQRVVHLLSNGLRVLRLVSC